MSEADTLGHPDLIVLPGTKNTMEDLLWMRQNGLEAAVLKAAAAQTPILGVCGGYQMLGRTLQDPEGTEGNIPGRTLRGLGLLPIDTMFTAAKTRTRVQAVVADGPWAGAHVDGYEIHMGDTQVQGQPFCRLENGMAEGCRQELVWGTYLHGLFDTGELTVKLADWLCARKGVSTRQAAPVDHYAYLQRQFDQLAEGVRHALDMQAIYRLMEEGR